MDDSDNKALVTFYTVILFDDVDYDDADGSADDCDKGHNDDEMCIMMINLIVLNNMWHSKLVYDYNLFLIKKFNISINTMIAVIYFMCMLTVYTYT